LGIKFEDGKVHSWPLVSEELSAIVIQRTVASLGTCKERLPLVSVGGSILDKPSASFAEDSAGQDDSTSLSKSPRPRIRSVRRTALRIALPVRAPHLRHQKETVVSV
jgi:hypothetical protein